MPESSSVPPSHTSFTIRYSTKVNVILGPIGLRVAATTTEDIQIPHPSICETTALWDTGASASVITAATVSALGLVPISRVMVNHAGGSSEQNVYLVDVVLPNKLWVNAVRVTECADTTGHFGVLIGMDIIGLGDFAVSNFEGKTTVTFRVPSKKEIDFNPTPPQQNTNHALANARATGYLPPPRGRRR